MHSEGQIGVDEDEQVLPPTNLLAHGQLANISRNMKSSATTKLQGSRPQISRAQTNAHHRRTNLSQGQARWV